MLVVLLNGVDLTLGCVFSLALLGYSLSGWLMGWFINVDPLLDCSVDYLLAFLSIMCPLRLVWY
jgi:hypothetical protein